jgi:hypothetical protein
MVPVPQHTVPVVEAQSGAPSHFHDVEPVTGHEALTDTHVDTVPAPGGSQHCFPAAHVMLVPPSPALNGQ